MAKLLPLLERAVESALSPAVSKPEADRLVEALLEAEKVGKKLREVPRFTDLFGSWRLYFVTGTKKARDRAGIVLGKGRYIPNWLKISLSYRAAEEIQLPEQLFAPVRIENCVSLGAWQLSLSGPAKFFSQKRLLAFDFTRITVQLSGIKLYEGYIRGGKNSEDKFFQESVGKQAFFAYFLWGETAIAARGKGGGLALWVRELK